MKTFNYVIDLFDQEEIATGEIEAENEQQAWEKIMENLKMNISIIE